ncbi:hypothetical protein HQ312_02565 [Rhodococcus sp. BP-316]|uniref:hypothetical protein n=1 Tax=Rhodococcus sp. BP-316 TaxID=2739445 RepID=UPI001C9B2AD6|nr:hypothetical protein [Rhodococcus sp. BP-316]MBY6679925.1 hypothetical protein [Rhodococcus sp. BP-316]
MYYLIRPDRTFQWLDFPRSTIELAQENGIDLGSIEWDPAERQFDEVTLRLALRYGIACSKGVAVGGVELVPRDRLVQLLRLNPAPSVMPHEDLMEQLVPGWRESGRELDRRVAESLERTIDEAKAEYEAAMAVAPDPALVEHWRALGGAVPDPL